MCILSCLAVLRLCAQGAQAHASAPRIVYTFNAEPLNHLDLGVPANAAKLWDTMDLLSALQGLANRQSPRFYLFYCEGFGIQTDRFWFDWFRGEDGWLKGSEVHSLGSVEEVLRVLRPVFKGLVVYDPRVPATADVACTAAGCEDLLPVRYDLHEGSIFERLVQRLKLPVKLWLVNPDGTSKFTGKGQIPGLDEPSSGSAKVDAYRWAVARYLRAGLCGPGIAAYYIDSFWLQHARRAGPTMHTLSNHDYFIAHRAFFFDLSPWGDERPNDDLDQPLGADRRGFLEVMRALYDRADGGLVQVGGFPPWPYKYTTHSQPPCKHGGVPTEWEFGRLISQFNGYMEADAAGLGAMANASFYQYYPLAGRYPQPNPKPGLAEWKAKGYVTSEGKVANKFFVGHYVGDYDSPSWLYKAVPAFFRDPARGKIPLGWAFDPNLADRAPQVLVYAYRHATTNDFFIAGDSGAGYLNPRGLTFRPDSHLPSGLGVWVAHCRRYYDRWGMSITGFILDGSSGASTETEYKAYDSFSPDGAGTHFEKGPRVYAGMATCPERDLPGDAGQAASVMTEAAHRSQGRPGFLWARSILRPPNWYADVSKALAKAHPRTPVVIVDPYTFFGLIKLAAEY